MVAAKLADKLKSGLTLNQAADLFLRRPHLATMHRWCLRGCRGVVLKSLLLGGVRYTSPEAIEQFLAALDAAADNTDALGDTEADAARRAKEAGKALEALGC